MRPARAPRLRLIASIVLLGLGPFASTVRAAEQPAWEERRITLPNAGLTTAFVPHAPTPHVVLLVSGDEGWTPALTQLARHLAALPAIVVGVPFPPLRRHAEREGGCWYLASDFELISHAAQKALQLPQYHAPVLVGSAAGAAAVFAALANTPAVTFAGAVSVGFCPTLRASVQVCSGDVWTPDYDDRSRTNRLPPSPSLPKDWHVLQGTADRTCRPDAVRPLVSATASSHFVLVEGGRHGLKPLAPWLHALDAALQDLWTVKDTRPPAAQPRSATTRELEDDLQRLQLPLEFRWPAQLSALLLFFSGDGGWASLDEDVAEHLVTRGIGVVGVSSLRYFWNVKPPAAVAADMRRLAAVLQRSGRPLFIGGFSFGAEIVPVAIKEWTAAERRQLSGMVLIAPSPSASFEIDPLDWIRTPTANPATLVAPAVREDGVPTVCVAGLDEEDTPCPSLNGAPGVRVVRLAGSHHFNNDYGAVAEAVAAFVRSAVERRP